ncbi:Uncharacterised protein [BD1-7 clade bacterium]|uniref:HPr kinase/phosphorylase n=1 Tax=BD1-7 clade bacterium TaxID=2029982 RepID=A0A5S9NW44_9GAMM|nr:Uncharacterised protein [BD1-7 clade bacterium]CAA0094931.1 Uncharacterised protein [BD1-7 clade bacterium]
MSDRLFTYRCFGFNITSELECPELSPTDHSTQPQVTIRFGDVPTQLESPEFCNPRFQIQDQQFLLIVDGVARYLVKDGKEITIAPETDADQDSVRLFLLGSVLGALLQQNDLLVLHGSVVEIDGQCAAFVGHSGRGKSTLAAAFRQNGYRILGDDLCVIKMPDDKTQRPTVYPGYPQAKLWHDSLESLDMDPESLALIRPNVSKRKLPIHDAFCDTERPLTHIFQLEPHNGKELDFRKMNGVKIIECLKTHTYRKQFLQGLKRETKHFKQCATLSQKVSVYHLNRPESSNFFQEEMINLVEAELAR